MQNGSSYKRIKRKSSVIIRGLFLFAVTVIIIALGVYFLLVYIIPKTEKLPKVSSLYELWETGDFEAVYNVASKIVEVHPLQNTALAFRGYSAYYMSIAQSDTLLTEMYLDDAIISLRNALLDAKPSSKGQLEYMLGKSYYQKNRLAGYHYYADLAVKYLDRAFLEGYTAQDMAEYRGFSYASLGMVEESITAFTEALLLNPTDMLLAVIGEQYYKLADYLQAQQYLFRVIQESEDELLVIKCRNILGNIYIVNGNFVEAKKEFTTILDKNPNYADAYYSLGVIYEKQGDMVKARSEWRKAQKIQANHPESREKMNL